MTTHACGDTETGRKQNDIGWQITSEGIQLN